MFKDVTEAVERGELAAEAEGCTTIEESRWEGSCHV